MIYWQLILVYLKIGMFGFGGGYAMLSLIQYEVVDHHHWLTLATIHGRSGHLADDAWSDRHQQCHLCGLCSYSKRVGSCRGHRCSMPSLVHPGIAHLLLLREMQRQQIHQAAMSGLLPMSYH